MTAADPQLRDRHMAGTASCADVMLICMWEPGVGAFTPPLEPNSSLHVCTAGSCSCDVICTGVSLSS